MKIGFGSTGKGYAAQKARTFMQSLGINAGIIDASGDMTTWGNQPNGDAWKIGITNPFNRHKMLDILSMKNAAVTTSGDYEKFILIETLKKTVSKKCLSAAPIHPEYKIPSEQC